MSDKFWLQVGELIGRYVAVLVSMVLLNLVMPSLFGFTAIAFFQLALIAAALTLLINVLT